MIKTLSAGLLVACWISGLSVVAYWHWFDNPVIYYNEELVAIGPVSLSARNPNGTLTLRLHSKFCQSRDVVPGTGQRTITNAVKNFLADTAAILAAGCYDTERSIELPPTLVLGPHLYHFEAQFRINPIKTITGKIKPVRFEVVQ